jgi:murein DD-endopeptidase MepM/ murein hydrolase activator NlpD
MKKVSRKELLLLFGLMNSLIIFSQESPIDFKVDGGDLKIISNDAQHPCITQNEYAILEKELVANVKKLGLDKKFNKNVLPTSFLWPLKLAAGFNQCQFHFIGAFVDQNTATTAIQDFNCETNTYDGHQGTDIAIAPYGFYKMDNNQVEVIAGAAGTIVQRADGNLDRNCSSNSLTANSIILQHSDGTYSLYWHMKKGSITTKTVGQTVVSGEYLGIVGSSGSSSGPHLHFEVRSGAASTTYKDPYSGSCNILNSNSYWVTQKPHTDPAILKVSVNTSDITLATCPTSDVPNESTTFIVPFQGSGLAAGYAKFYVFLRDYPANTPLDMKILNPNGTVFNSWTYAISTFYKTSYWGFSKLLPTLAGIYTFQATYNGNTCSQNFTITTALENDSFLENGLLQIYPNPTNDFFTIKGQSVENGNYHYTISNVNGQIIDEENIYISNNSINKLVSISELSKGIYFISFENGKNKITKKIIKN